MADQNHVTNRKVNNAALTKYMFVGMLIGFALISTFVFGVDNPNPAWGEYWRVRPLIITPLAGAAAGAVLYFSNYIGAKRGWPKALSVAYGLFFGFIGLWMGVVLGLDGTLWD